MTSPKELIVVAFVSISLTACAMQRAQEAEDAKSKMVGMSKEAVFTCMGPPAQKSVEGKTEIWSYPSGNGHVESVGIGNAVASGSANYGSAVGLASGQTEQMFCLVNLVMVGGMVKAVNYNGPTGGWITKGEQCAYAIENCIKTNTASTVPRE